MSAQPAEARGLSQAQQQLDDLLDKLNSTVELAGELANAGEDETALRLLAQQRAHLYEVVDSISRDIGTGPRPLLARVRRHLGLVAAAIVMMLSCAAASFVAMQTTPAEQVNEDLRRATRIGDPAARLTALLAVHDEASTLPPEDSAEIRAEVVQLLQQTEPVVPDDPQNEEVKRRADKLSRDVEQARQLKPPQGPDDAKRFATDVEEVLE